ncbi:MAG: hypothetical protein N3E50_00805 [Candidatus Goldbacteria bacterium]|nr:hypothetical protein [Candidatus Goldiibacteriota bacterium]
MTHDRQTIRQIIEIEKTEEFKKVKKYLQDNPMASIFDVYSNTGVPLTKIMGYIQLGLFKLKELP